MSLDSPSVFSVAVRELRKTLPRIAARTLVRSLVIILCLAWCLQDLYPQGRTASKLSTVKVPLGNPRTDPKVNFQVSVTPVPASSNRFTISLIFTNTTTSPFDFVCVPLIIDDKGTKITRSKKKMTRTGDVTAWSVLDDGSQNNKKPIYNFGGYPVSLSPGGQTAVLPAEQFIHSDFNAAGANKLYVILNILRSPSGVSTYPVKGQNVIGYPKGNNSQKPNYSYSAGGGSGMKLTTTILRSKMNVSGGPLTLVSTDTVSRPVGNAVTMANSMDICGRFQGYVQGAPVGTMVEFMFPDTTFDITVQHQSDPTVNVPVCTSSGEQLYPAIAEDGFGGAFIAWEDRRDSVSHIYVQRVNSFGVPQWETDGVRVCNGSGKENQPDILSDGAGGAIVAWTDYRSGPAKVYLQRLNDAGELLWAEEGVRPHDGTAYSPALTTDGHHGCIVAFSFDSTFVQRIDSSGNRRWGSGGTWIMGTYQNPSIVSDTHGGAIVATEEFPFSFWASCVDSTGTDVWDTQFGTFIIGEPYPKLIGDGMGGAYVSWMDLTSGNFQITVQRLSALGGSPWRRTVGAAASDQMNSQLADDGSGDVIVTWQDYDFSVSQKVTLLAQRLSRIGGTKLWGASGTPIEHAPTDKQIPRIICDGSGGAIIVWEDVCRRDANNAPDLYSQRINSSGAIQWAGVGVPVTTAAGYQQDAQMVTDASHGAWVTWKDDRNGSSNHDIYAQRIQSDGTLPGTGASRSFAMLSSTSATVDSFYFNLPYEVPDTAVDPVIRAWLGFPPGTMEEGSVSRIDAFSINGDVATSSGDSVYSWEDPIISNSWIFVRDTKPPYVSNWALEKAGDTLKIDLTAGDSSSFNSMAYVQFQRPGDTVTTAGMEPGSPFILNGGTHWAKSVLSDSIRFRFILVDDYGNTDTTDFQDLTVPLGQTALLSPPDGTSGVSSSSVLKWHPMTGALSYGVEVALDSSFVSPAYDDTVFAGWPAISFRTDSLIADTIYYWRARAMNATGPGPWSERWHFSSYPGSVAVMHGWNILSTPVNPANRAKAAIFPGARSNAFAYLGNYVSKDTLDSGLGYWIKFDTAQTVTFHGPLISDDRVPVRQTWNIISPMGYVATADSIGSDPSDLIASSFFGFDTAGYQPVSVLLPGKGYWVKAKSAGFLTLSTARPFLKRGAPEKALTGMDRLTFADALGHQQSLYLVDPVKSHVKPAVFELPPAPPAGVLDARFASNLMVETYPDFREGAIRKEFRIEVRTGSYPVTLRWEMENVAGIEYRLKDAPGGLTLNRDLSSRQGSLIIKGPEVKTLILSVTNRLIPKEYALHQNYPNPFNPTTRINYQLPTASRVVLKIYDILGEEVRTLADEIQEAGYRSVEWNSTNDQGQVLASGVYFYRFEAASIVSAGRTFTKVNKMLLLK